MIEVDDDNKKPLDQMSENKNNIKEKYSDDELAEAVKEIEKDPVAFCDVFLHIHPFSYQEAFLRDPSKRIVICAGRRVGKSVMTAARALWFSLTHPNTVTLIVSATLRQSMLMFDTILDDIEKSRWISDAVTRKTRTLIKFRNGSKIKALPCGKGKGIRGETTQFVILDEASFMPDDVIAEAILPMLATTDGTVIMLSTPYDRNHIFYKAFTSEMWSRYSYPTSINPMVKQEFLDEQRELIGEKRFRQEFLAEFVDDDRAYFPQALLRSAVHSCESIKQCPYCEIISSQEALAKYIENNGVSVFGGHDPGGKGDPAAFVCVEKMHDGKFRVLLVKTYLAQVHGKKVEDEKIYTRFTTTISDLDKILKMRRLFVDQTGLGSPIVEHCKDLKLPAEGLNLNLKTKEVILSKLRILFEQGKIILPSADRDMMHSLLSNLNCIEYERTHGGGYSFSHPQGTHDDIAYTLALAIWGAAQSSASVVMMVDEPPNEPTWRQGMKE